MKQLTHLSTAELEANLSHLKDTPKDKGILHMIVRRPETDDREVLQEGELDLVYGLVGDNWRSRGSKRTTNGLGHPDMQINIMNSRVIELIAQDKERWALAGDQFFVDLDLSGENLPPGTQLQFGSAVLEVTEIPHTGCAKFMARFGKDAHIFVNSPVGKELNLRGICAKVVQAGTVQVGDLIEKIRSAS